jgi:hypothetical protein
MSSHSKQCQPGLIVKIDLKTEVDKKLGEVTTPDLSQSLSQSI